MSELMYAVAFNFISEASQCLPSPSPSQCPSSQVSPSGQGEASDSLRLFDGEEPDRHWPQERGPVLTESVE